MFIQTDMLQQQNSNRNNLLADLQDNLSNRCEEHSQTGRKHLSQRHVFPTAHSSESSAEWLNYQRAAPASFVVEALANPITMIRQSGKLIEAVRSDIDNDSVLMSSAVSWPTELNVRHTWKRILHIVNPVWCTLNTPVWRNTSKCKRIWFRYGLWKNDPSCNNDGNGEKKKKKWNFRTQRSSNWWLRQRTRTAMWHWTKWNRQPGTNWEGYTKAGHQHLLAGSISYTHGQSG